MTGVHRRRRAAGPDLGGGVRDDPRRRRRADADLGVVGGARHLRHGHQEGRGHASSDEVRVARFAAFVIGGIAIALAIPAQKLNIAFLVALAFAVAASANLPSLIYNLFWRGFNTRGAVWAIYGGLISCVGLVFFSPVVSGSPTSLFTDHDWSWFPLSNPGIISIPLGFFLGWLGSVTAKEPAALDRYTELEVRSLTGAGAEQAVGTDRALRAGRAGGLPGGNPPATLSGGGSVHADHIPW